MSTLKRTSLGELRPSQLLYTFGTGAIVDLPHVSAMVMGLEDWATPYAKPIQEERLLEQVRRRLGPQVAALLTPPMRDEPDEGFFQAFDDSALVGVPVASFPRWMRCPACGLLAPLASGLFHLRTTPGRPDLAQYVHHNCNKLSQPAVLPARFLFACEAGHLDDFPWRWFVHRGEAGCFGILELREHGVSGEAAEVEVTCRECGKTRRMADAFLRDTAGVLPACRGRRPQLRDFDEEPCRSQPEAILLGASNIWFPVTLSVLYVPSPPGSELDHLVEQHWTTLADADEIAVVRFLRKQGKLGPFAAFTDDDIWSAIEARRKPASTSDEQSEEDLKTPEWRVFSVPDPKRNGPDFELRTVEPPAGWGHWIERVVLAERLREVTALTAFTRIGSPRDYAENEPLPSKIRAAISRKPPVFAPAAEVRGEGIFLQFHESILAAWCDAHGPHEEAFRTAHTSWRRRRQIASPETGFPGMRYVVLHSFAHALMRELALECGYNMASLRERIYARDDEGKGDPMAGVLIYTAAPDAEGTLGGLVRMGRPDELGRHLERAMEQMQLCSSDPLCSDHAPEADGTTLHGACCHACLFAPETSCERGNRYLDRGVLVPTVGGATAGFFARS